MNGVIRAEKRAPAKAHLRMEARQTGCDQITKGLINFFKEFRLYLKGKWGVTEVQGICLDLNVGRTDVCEKILFSQGLHLSSGPYWAIVGGRPWEGRSVTSISKLLSQSRASLFHTS